MGTVGRNHIDLKMLVHFGNHQATRSARFQVEVPEIVQVLEMSKLLGFSKPLMQQMMLRCLVNQYNWHSNLRLVASHGGTKDSWHCTRHSFR